MLATATALVLSLDLSLSLSRVGFRDASVYSLEFSSFARNGIWNYATDMPFIFLFLDFGVDAFGEEV